MASEFVQAVRSPQASQPKNHIIWRGPDLDSESGNSAVSNHTLDDNAQFQTCSAHMGDIMLEAEVHHPVPCLSQPEAKPPTESGFGVHSLWGSLMPNTSLPSTESPLYMQQDSPDEMMARRIELSEPPFEEHEVGVEPEAILDPAFFSPVIYNRKTSDESQDGARHLDQHLPGSAGGNCVDPLDLARAYRMFPLGGSGYPIPVDSMEHGHSNSAAFSAFTEGDFCATHIDGKDRNLPHEKRSQRPCKGKRDRYRKLVLRIQQAIEEDPDGFDLEQTQLPPSIAANRKLKQKLKKRVQAYTSIVQSERQEDMSAQSTQMKVMHFDDFSSVFSQRPGLLGGPVYADMLPVATEFPANLPVTSDGPLLLSLSL